MMWKAHLEDEGFAPRTVNQRLSSLKSVVKLAKTRNLISWDITVKSTKVSAYSNTSGPGKGNVKRMINYAQYNLKGPLKTRTLVILLFTMGLRRNKIVNLDLDDFNYGENKYSV